MKQEKSGIRGFLLLFIITLSIYAILSLLYSIRAHRLATMLIPWESTTNNFIFLHAIITFSVLLYSVFILILKKEYAIRTTISILVVEYIVYWLINIFLYSKIYEYSINSSAFILHTCIRASWILYLLKSSRVKNTYCKNAHDKYNFSFQENKRDEYQENETTHCNHNSIPNEVLEALNFFELDADTLFFEIKKKYILLSKIYHPDKNNSDEYVKNYAHKKTIQLNKYYEILKNFYNGR